LILHVVCVEDGIKLQPCCKCWLYGFFCFLFLCLPLPPTKPFGSLWHAGVAVVLVRHLTQSRSCQHTVCRTHCRMAASMEIYIYWNALTFCY